MSYYAFWMKKEFFAMKIVVLAGGFSPERNVSLSSGSRVCQTLRELGHEVKVGEGKANFPALLKGLKEHGFDGSLTIEREISGEQQLTDIRETQSYLQGLIDQL